MSKIFWEESKNISTYLEFKQKFWEKRVTFNFVIPIIFIFHMNIIIKIVEK